jgi:hypothetical protein
MLYVLILFWKAEINAHLNEGVPLYALVPDRLPLFWSQDPAPSLLFTIKCTPEALNWPTAWIPELTRLHIKSWSDGSKLWVVAFFGPTNASLHVLQ